MTPLIFRLKKLSHKEIAKAQDLIVQTLFEVCNEAVLHGGTTIWRCYQGNRFSEDIDAYLPKEINKVNFFFEKLQQRGFSLEKKKIGENSIYSNLLFNRTAVRFEAVFKKTNGHLREYEMIDGSKMMVYALSVEELIEEKINTYLKRRKIRDLYDIFILLKQVRDSEREMIAKKLKEFVKDYQDPLDEKDLQVLILEGLVPNTTKMLEYLEEWR